MAKIGVIVPVYNVERYLGTCVESILAQTFSDLELILVDDGSTDGSGALCGQYAERDKRVRVVHMEHQGVAAARNRGLRENRNEHLVFVDSDDWIAREHLETLYRLMEAHQADLVIGSVRNVLEGQKIETDESWKEAAAEPVSKAEAYRRMCVCENNVSVSPCSKLYHRALFRSVSYPAGEIYEDLEAIDRIIESCEKIVCTSYGGYYYFRRRGSIVHGRFTPGHRIAIQNAKRLWDFLRERYPEVADAGKVNYLRNCFNILNLAIVDPDNGPEARRLRGEILREARFFFSCRWFSPVERIAVICLLPGLSWYKLAWKAYLWCTGKLSGTVVS